MAKYIPVGTPLNKAEAQGLRQLRDVLPAHYIVVGNFELQLPRRRNTLEFDVVVIGDWGVYSVEIKGWSGRIRGDARRWKLQWGRVENPFIRAEGKAKALRDLLVREVAGWPDALHVESVVYLTSKKVTLCVNDARCRRILSEDAIQGFFVEEASMEGEERPELVALDDALKQRIMNALVPLATPASQLPFITNYRIVEELKLESQSFREFVGHHTLLRSRSRVRIKRYSLDPLIAPAERDDALARILRDMEALNTMADNVYIARAYELIRDMEDELVFYMVSELPSRRSLRDLFEEQRPGYAQCTPPERRARWRLGWHLIKAIASTHARGVAHRNLHPGVISLIEDASSHVPLKISDFDFARIGTFDLVADMLRSIIKQGYGAPEMWLEDVHDHRVDVYSVGALLFELLMGVPLYTEGMALLRHDEIWERRRMLLPDDACRAIWDSMLAYSQEKRIHDLGTLLPFFAEHAGAPALQADTGQLFTG